MKSLSIIVPVYNRPDEVKDLLKSLSRQRNLDSVEVVVVEDGSDVSCKDVVDQFSDALDIVYLAQENGGPSKARNAGANVASGDFLYFFDSDCIIPDDFFVNLSAELLDSHLDCFGTIDCADASFSPIQKAISYSMTSYFTTGGIRGGVHDDDSLSNQNKRMDKFYPRSYSMGVRADVFRQVHGFDPDMRYGEDIDFSMRVLEAGFNVGLISSAFVYHRRRSTFKSFFKQTFCSGTARIDLALRHKGALKLVHLLPSVAVIVLAAILVASVVVSPLLLILLAAYGLLVFADAFGMYRSLGVAFLSVFASAIQISGYGLGFISNAWLRLVCHSRKVAFQKSLYK